VPRERWWVDAADQTDAPGPLEELSRDELIVVAGAQREVIARQCEVIAQLQAVVAKLQSTVVALQQRVTELEHESGRHSGNSSKPPSTDTQTQRETNRSERVQPGQGRRRGKQKGADGKNLQAVADPDVRLTHRPYARNGTNSTQAASQSLTIAGYLPPHFSLNSTKRSSAASSVGAVWTGRKSFAIASQSRLLA